MSRNWRFSYMSKKRSFTVARLRSVDASGIKHPQPPQTQNRRRIPITPQHPPPTTLRNNTPLPHRPPRHRTIHRRPHQHRPLTIPNTTSHQLLSTILKAAVRSRKLGTNPADGITLPHIYPKTKRFIDTDQIEQLANVVPDRYESWINTAAYGGLRWAELAGLRRKASTPSNNDSQSPKASAK
jgi:hypothetical protein